MTAEAPSMEEGDLGWNPAPGQGVGIYQCNGYVGRALRGFGLSWRKRIV